RLEVAVAIMRLSAARRQPALLLAARGEHLVQARGRRSIQALLLLVGDELERQADSGERLGRPRAAAAEPRVVHEPQMAQGLHRRPLAADTLVLRTLGHRLEPPPASCTWVVPRPVPQRPLA